MQGYGRAQFNLGNLYREGVVIIQDMKKAFDFSQAAVSCTKAAAEGDKGAIEALPGLQYCVAHCYMEGNGVDQNVQRALTWAV